MELILLLPLPCHPPPPLLPLFIFSSFFAPHLLSVRCLEDAGSRGFLPRGEPGLRCHLYSSLSQRRRSHKTRANRESPVQATQNISMLRWEEQKTELCLSKSQLLCVSFSYTCTGCGYPLPEHCWLLSHCEYGRSLVARNTVKARTICLDMTITQANYWLVYRRLANNLMFSRHARPTSDPSHY